MRSLVWSLLLLMVLWGCGKKESKPNGPEGEPINVVFVTDPSGATVYFDGDSIGVTRGEGEPALILRDVQPGEHTYRIELEGYIAIQREYRPQWTGGTKRVEETLTNSTTVTISTDPPGAYVTFGGEFQTGRTTPLTIDEVPAGKYEVRVQKEGYMVLYDSLDVASGMVERTFTLFEPPEVESLTFRGVHKNERDYVYPNDYGVMDVKYFDTSQATT